VNDQSTYALLETILRRENRSLLQYIRDAFPWTPLSEQEVLKHVHCMADEQKMTVGALAQFLTRKRHTVSHLASYPSSFTTINYASLDYVMRCLLVEERKALAQLEGDRAAISDEEAGAIVDCILARKRQDLKQLEEMAAAHPPTAVL
jgi:hypothetical protein